MPTTATHVNVSLTRAQVSAINYYMHLGPVQITAYKGADPEAVVVTYLYGQGVRPSHVLPVGPDGRGTLDTEGIREHIGPITDVQRVAQILDTYSAHPDRWESVQDAARELLANPHDFADYELIEADEEAEPEAEHDRYALTPAGEAYAQRLAA